MNKNNCKELEKKMDLATQILEQEMARIWPKEKMIHFMINHNQRIPSRGEVRGHNGPYIRVKMDTLHQSIKRVHYSHII